MADTKTLTISGQDYDVRVTGDELVVSLADGSGDLTETVALEHLGDAARDALKRGDLDDSAAATAIDGLARALADRGA